MRNSLKVLAIVAVVALVAGTASAVDVAKKPSLGINGGTLPPAQTTPVVKAASTTLVPDGDFEYGPQGGTWKENTSTQCEWVLNPTSIWGVGPFSGFYTWWAGGYCGGQPNSNAVKQTVTVPVGTTSLDLYAVLYRVDADDVPADGDHLLISTGNCVVPFMSTNNTYPNWVLLSCPVSAGLGGQTVSLKIKGFSAGSLTGNSLIDYVSFNP
jgi:hypothetical protein